LTLPVPFSPKVIDQPDLALDASNPTQSGRDRQERQVG